MRISVVMSYHNRLRLLEKTMESIAMSEVRPHEIIIMDDASDIPLVCEGAKVVRIELKDRWYNNSCVAYNMGFKMATGDVILIQNPECYHVGDILSYVEENIKEGLYLSFGCYSLNREETDAFHDGTSVVIRDGKCDTVNRNGWYNHSVYRPVGYHFCSAITTTDMNRLGGFDEKYAMGVGFDDDDLVQRVKGSMEMRLVDNPHVLHQYHTHERYDRDKTWYALWEHNENIFYGR
jgi:glycosyltransferase involved in cell wall biosynthesis